MHIKHDYKRNVVIWCRAINDDERDDPIIVALGDVDEVPVEMPGKRVKCSICKGKGYIVDYDEDDPHGTTEWCESCDHRGSWLIVDEAACDPDILAAFEDAQADEDQYQRECYQERLMGC
jgi:hypothetical protein